MCTYDDFDSDYDGTYHQVIGELNPTVRGYRTHGPRGNHNAARPVPAVEDKGPEGFGAGIM